MKQRISHMMTAGLVAGAVMTMAGCAQPPVEQLEAAKKAVEAAQAAGATEYAKDDFAKLEQEYALAKDELAKQEKALSIFRSYSEANKLLIKVVEDGGRVAATAAQNKETAKTAALAMEKEAQQVIASAKELMAQAPTGKERAAVEVIKQDLAALETSLNAVHQLIEKGDYLGAEAQAKALKDKGAGVSGDLQHAIEKTKGNKPKGHA